MNAKTIPIRPASQTEDPQFEAFVAATAGASERPSVQISRLGVLSYASGFTTWVYRHGGPFAECLAAGFFDDAMDLLARGDMMAICAADGSGWRSVAVSERGRPYVVPVL